MERLTFVDEDGMVLFDNPAGFPEDIGFTIRELAENEEWEALDNIAERLANCEQRLKYYEDLEEQGLLLKLPVPIGDTVYVLCECGMIPQQLDGTLYDSDGSPGTATGYYCPYEDNCPHDCEENEDIFDCDKFRQKSAVFEDTVKSIKLEDETIYISTENCNIYSPIGYAIFLTQSEAEEALKRWKGRNDYG